MKKYEQHGLTCLEDTILGAYGTTDNIDLEELTTNRFTPAHRQAFASLIRKGLLKRKFDENENVTYLLTPTGKALYKTRAKEEEEGPDERL